MSRRTTRLRRLHVLLTRAVVAATLLTTCAAALCGEWALAAYFDVGEDLRQDARDHREAIWRAAEDLPVAIQTVLRSPSGVRAERWLRDEAAPNCSREEAGPGDADLGSFLSWARRRMGDTNLILALLGHGLPPECGREPTAGSGRLFASASSAGLSATEVGHAIDVGASGTDGQIILVLESCFGASLELLDAVSGSVDFVIAAPAGVYTPGLPWAKMLSQMRPGTELSGMAVAQALALQAAAGEPGAASTDSITVCDMSRFAEVRRGLAEVSGAAITDLPNAVAGAQWARARASRGEKLQQLADAGELARALEGYAKTDELRVAARHLIEALAELVIARHFPAGGPDEINAGRAGLTVFLPPALGGTAAGYAKNNRLARTTGYGKFVQSYLGYCAALVPGIGARVGAE